MTNLDNNELDLIEAARRHLEESGTSCEEWALIHTSVGPSDHLWLEARCGSQRKARYRISSGFSLEIQDPYTDEWGLVTDIEKLMGLDESCEAIIWHGPGHQSMGKCELKGPHDEHQYTIPGEDQVLNWTGEEGISSIFDHSPI